MASKTLIRLQATDYDQVPQLKDKIGVETEARNGDITVNLRFKARDIINMGQATYAVERQLQEIVDSTGFTNVAVHGRTHAYLSNVKITGILNTSPFVVKGGLSELSKAQILYLNKIKPGIVSPEHMKRIEAPDPIYNFQVPSTSHLFPEGHPASRAFEELAETHDDVYDFNMTQRNDEATPHSQFMSTQIALYKGVTHDTLSRSCFHMSKNKNFVCTPTNSLMASLVRDNTSVFVYDQEEFAEGQDMLMTLPTTLAQELRRQIVNDAADLQEACMRDISKLTLNISADTAYTDWEYNADTDEIVSKSSSSMRFRGDHEFFIRLRINMNALYVRITSNTMARTHDGSHIHFPVVWNSADIRQNGKVRKGATPIHVPTTASTQDELAEPQFKKHRNINEEEEEKSVAASSAPIDDDGDD